MRHHVDNVLPSMCWNKAWLEQNLEQVLLSKIKELGGFVPVFQCSDQQKVVWEMKIKLAKSFVLFSECKTFFAKTPSILRTPRTLEQSVLSPLLLLLYYIYYIYINQRLTESTHHTKNLVPVPLVKLYPSEHQNTNQIKYLRTKEQGKNPISARNTP